VTDDDLSWMQRPPAFIDPQQAKAATELLRRPSNVPRGHTDAGQVKAAQREDLHATPASLAPEYVWIFPGLAYCMIGLDRSLFDLYAAATGITIAVRTHRADKTLFDFRGADVSGNPWFATIQGVPQSVAADFLGFVSTFEFRNTSGPQAVSWFVEPVRTRIADPFVSKPLGVDVTILLPGCLTTRRAVVIAESAGIHLAKPVLGIKAASRDPV